MSKFLFLLKWRKQICFLAFSFIYFQDLNNTTCESARPQHVPSYISYLKIQHWAAITI